MTHKTPSRCNTERISSMAFAVVPPSPLLAASRARKSLNITFRFLRRIQRRRYIVPIPFRCLSLNTLCLWLTRMRAYITATERHGTIVISISCFRGTNGDNGRCSVSVENYTTVKQSLASRWDVLELMHSDSRNAHNNANMVTSKISHLLVVTRRNYAESTMRML